MSLGEPMELCQRSDRLTLAWDPPFTDVARTPLKVVSYEIFYREHGGACWSQLDEIDASSRPEYTIRAGQLHDGLYDFAVRAVSQNGQVSSLHSSLDNSADPISGWFVLWINEE
jgi:hypothetical protein